MKTTRLNHRKIAALLCMLISFIPILTIFLLLESNSYVYANPQATEELLDITQFIYPVAQEQERISYGPKLVSIKRGTEIHTILTTLTDIRKIVKEVGITLADNDVLYMNTRYLVDGTIMRIIREDVVETHRYINIPYTTQTLQSTKYIQGEKHTIQEGVLGVRLEKLKYYYEDGHLVKTEIYESEIQTQPKTEIIEVGVSFYSLDGITIRGYNCPYWYSVVDSGSYTSEEKRWLKYIMYCESGCNAESNKSTYKGLFQWSPYWWRKQHPENIFDGYAQLKHTIEKYRAGESTRAQQWPACHAKYRSLHPL